MSEQVVLIHKASLSLAAANSTTTSIDSDFEVSNILIHFSGATSTTVSVTVDSHAGASYDTLLWSRTLAADTDVALLYTGGEVLLNKGDEIKVSFTISAGITANIIIYYILR